VKAGKQRCRMSSYGKSSVSVQSCEQTTKTFFTGFDIFLNGNKVRNLTEKNPHLTLNNNQPIINNHMYISLHVT